MQPNYTISDYILILILVILSSTFGNNYSNQFGGDCNEAGVTGGAGGAGGAGFAPFGTAFAMIFTAVGIILKFFLLIFTIILIPSLPVLLYMIAAYFVMKAFIGNFSTI